MENKQKLLSAISLCRKAGKLVKGYDAVQESVYSGKAWLVLLAADVSDGTAKRMNRTCEELVEVSAYAADPGRSVQRKL